MFLGRCLATWTSGVPRTDVYLAVKPPLCTDMSDVNRMSIEPLTAVSADGVEKPVTHRPKNVALYCCDNVLLCLLWSPAIMDYCTVVIL